MYSEYDQLKKRIEESCQQYETRQRIIRAKREEKRQIKKAGGGKAIARKILAYSTRGDDTDFNYGQNVNEHETTETLDERISREQADRCMGKAICNTCGKYHGYCAELTEDKEKLKMLPTGDGKPSNKRQGGMNWVTLDDLTTSNQEAKILMVRYNEKGTYGPSVTLKLAFKGDIKYLNVRPVKTDPRYKIMLDTFGPDENNWVDQRILLRAQKDDFTESFRMNVDVAEKKMGKK